MSARNAIIRGGPAAFSVVLACLGMGFTWPSREAEDQEPNKVALLVGINNYNRRKLEDRPLRFAERDVQELAVVLQEQKFAVRTLTGRDATKANIDEALTALLKGPKKEVVVVAFAGHGMQLALEDEQGNLVRDAQGRELSDAFFCPFDAVAGKGSTMISLTRLIERLDNEGGTNLFLVDACRDDFDPRRGLGKRSLSGDELVGRLPGNSAILFSCSKGQQALEHEGRRRPWHLLPSGHPGPSWGGGRCRDGRGRLGRPGRLRAQARQSAGA